MAKNKSRTFSQDRGALALLLAALFAPSAARAHLGHLPASHGLWHWLGDPVHALTTSLVVAACTAATLVYRHRQLSRGLLSRRGRPAGSLPSQRRRS